jgi:hypothetical protein
MAMALTAKNKLSIVDVLFLNLQLKLVLSIMLGLLLMNFLFVFHFLARCVLLYTAGVLRGALRF